MHSPVRNALAALALSCGLAAGAAADPIAPRYTAEFFLDGTVIATVTPPGSSATVTHQGTLLAATGNRAREFILAAPPGAAATAGWLLVTTDGTATGGIIAAIHFLGTNQLVFGINDGSFPYAPPTLPGAGGGNIAYGAQVALGNGLAGITYTPTGSEPGSPGGALAGRDFSYIFVTALPEPAGLALLGAGLLGIGLLRRRG